MREVSNNSFLHWEPYWNARIGWFDFLFEDGRENFILIYFSLIWGFNAGAVIVTSSSDERLQRAKSLGAYDGIYEQHEIRPVVDRGRASLFRCTANNFMGLYIIREYKY